MYYLVLPYGNDFGWGICGTNIARELAKIRDVRLATRAFHRKLAGNELEFRFFSEKIATEQDIAFLRDSNDKYPVLQATDDHRLTPYFQPVRGSRKIGHAVFEQRVSPTDARKAADYFDIITTGSTWCAAMLRDLGLDRVAPVIQGIDPLAFNPAFSRKEFFADRFVVFSGGKLEFRKGQDVVIRAYKVLQDKHPDVMLVNSWFNHWNEMTQTMARSKLIRFQPRAGDHVTNVTALLAENGIDVNRVVSLPLQKNELFARVYQNTDIGLFPNRCEGGTNLVMMEYMACGKPVIASNSSGHRDILNDHNALVIQDLQPVEVRHANQFEAVWDEPDLDETIHHLEWAYHHRGELQQIGQAAGKHLAGFTWERTARTLARFLDG